MGDLDRTWRNFYEALTLSSVPVDLRALRALKRSPLAMDLYAWLTYTAFVATKARRPRTVSWEALHAQMGADTQKFGCFGPMSEGH